MPSAQGVSSTIERAESANASVGTRIPRVLESVHVREIRNRRRETAGEYSRLGVAGGHGGVKLSHTMVGGFLFKFEFLDLVSEVPEFLFDSYLACGVTHGSGVRTGQGKRDGGRDDLGKGGGGWAGTRGEFGV